jgi:hypothetical protein
VPLHISGRRGSGKMLLLHWLAEELKSAWLLRDRQPTDDADAEAVHRFAAHCHSEKTPTLLLLDDFDVSLSDPLARAGNRALVELVRGNDII